MGRSEWCISRQRSWGLPIPAIYDVATGEPTLSTESLAHIITVLQEKGTDHWWSDEVDEFIPPHLRDSGRTFRKGTDTMDVWFDSGSSWKLIKDVMAGERPSSEPLADAYLEGSDQHRGWFQSSLLTRLSEAKDGEAGAPFTNLITHGFVLDEAGTKMSKSLGNTLSPMEVINGGQVGVYQVALTIRTARRCPLMVPTLCVCGLLSSSTPVTSRLAPLPSLSLLKFSASFATLSDF
jgi:isoleucyl-tRNA synthetase